MIRRQLTLPDGTQFWSLISQIEHARISGELAAAWGNNQVAPVICAEVEDSASPAAAVRSEVLSAIYHHDDGWAAWQLSPGIDTAHSRPFAFTEMPLAESLAIWSESVARCDAIGQLAGWMVAGHFVLLLGGSHWQDEPSARRWMNDMDCFREQRFARWKAAAPSVYTKPLADEALFWLRSFDALSLWFCCGETGEFRFPPEALESTQGDRRVTFSCATSAEVAVTPWPFNTRQVELQTPALRVPVGQYSTTEELLNASRTHEHQWKLRAHGQSC